jgi:hypothetical protein
MPTEVGAECFDFGMVVGRAVEAAFDAGLVTSDAGALLLGATDRAIGMIDWFAACFHDERRADLITTYAPATVGTGMRLRTITSVTMGVLVAFAAVIAAGYGAHKIHDYRLRGHAVQAPPRDRLPPSGLTVKTAALTPVSPVTGNSDIRTAC